MRGDDRPHTCRDDRRSGSGARFLFRSAARHAARERDRRSRARAPCCCVRRVTTRRGCAAAGRVAVRAAGHGTQAALKWPGVGRSHDWHVMGRRPAAPAAGGHHAGSRAVLDGGRPRVRGVVGRRSAASRGPALLEHAGGPRRSDAPRDLSSCGRGLSVRSPGVLSACSWHEVDTDTSHVLRHAVGMGERAAPGDDEARDAGLLPGERGPAGPPSSWIALPVGRTENGPTIRELVDAVRAAGGIVGGEALFDPRYEAEMRRFLIRALEMEGIPVPKGGGRP